MIYGSGLHIRIEVLLVKAISFFYCTETLCRCCYFTDFNAVTAGKNLLSAILSLCYSQQQNISVLCFKEKWRSNKSQQLVKQ